MDKGACVCMCVCVCEDAKMAAPAGFLDDSDRDSYLRPKEYENENQPKQNEGSSNPYIDWKKDLSDFDVAA